MSGVTLDWDSEEDDSSLLTVDQAAKRLRISRRTFERDYWATGVIARYKCDDRKYRYRLEDVTVLESDERTDDNPELLDTPTAALLAQAYSHSEMLMKQVHAQNIALMNILTTENQRLRDSNAALERVHFDLVKAQQEALNEQSERDLARTQVDREENRKDKAIDALKVLGAQALENHRASKLATAGAQFLSMISDEQIDMLLMFGPESDVPVITQAQADMLTKLKQSRSAKPAEKKPDIEVKEENNG